MEGKPLIEVLVLQGNKREMGNQYGSILKNKLESVLKILTDFYVTDKGIKFSSLVKKADVFYNKYSYSYQNFIKGMAEGSGLSLDECKILNGMETLNSLLFEKQEVSACSLISVPPHKSDTNAVLIGRNYDFFEPFQKCSKFLTVTVLKEADSIPTAFISMAGQIYCPTCINKESLFVEFNNGMPSGGFETNHKRESLLINLLEVLQQSQDLTQLDYQLSALNSDYSLIINIANKEQTKSYEYSAKMGMRPYNPEVSKVFASTNFFLNDTWPVPGATDESAWLGVTRRENLLQSFTDKDKYSVFDVMNILDKDIASGGATWNLTIYQIAFDSAGQRLYLKLPHEGSGWQDIDLGAIFQDNFTGLHSDITETYKTHEEL